MDFWDITVRYVFLCAPVYLGYMALLRFSRVSPKWLGYVWTAANLGIAGYLVHWGSGTGGMSVLRAALFTACAMVVVLTSGVGVFVFVRPGPTEADPT